MAAKVKSKWSRTPRVGTKQNDAFRSLLRGVTARELASILGSHRNVSTFIIKMRNECGFDVRSLGYGGPHMIVGRHKWGGGYVSFIDPKDYC